MNKSERISKLKNRIHIATMCAQWQKISENYGVPLELDYYCQAENMDGDKGEEVRELVLGLLQKYQLRIVHGPFNELFPAAIDPRARQLAMDRLNQAAKLAIEFNIKKMVVHSGYVPFVYFKDWHVDRSVEFWKEFMSDKPDDFEICIENVLDDEPGMLAEIAERVGDRRVGLCYDVGHANIVGELDQEEWLDSMAPYLKHVHIHNNSGDGDYHKGFAEGTVNIEKILDRVIKDCHEDTTVTAEILTAGESFQWLAEKGYI